MIPLDFEKLGGLVPAVVQDFQTGEVLMLGFMNRLAWEKTLETKLATFWSRSRNELWIKGATSGNTQAVKEIWVDCDNDSVVLKVEQKGAACHTGHRSCFYRRVDPEGLTVVGTPLFDPEKVYKNKAGKK